MNFKLVQEDNQVFAIKHYTIDGTRIRLSAPAKKDSSNEIICFHAGVRSWITGEPLSPVVSYWMAAKEYFEELDIIVEIIDREIFIVDIEPYVRALFKLVQNHVSSYNRLIDTDLESYINRIMTVYVQMAVVDDSLNQVTCRKVMEKLEVEVYNKFDDYIYITNRNPFTLDPFQRSSLTKYKQ